MAEIDLQKQITQLTDRVNELEIRPVKLDRYLDNTSKDIIDDVIADNILDITWEDYFYYSTNFESGDGFSQTGLPVFDEGGVLVQTSSTSGTSSVIQRDMTLLTSVNFAKESRFRTKINASTGRIMESEFGIGAASTPNLSGHAYGFRINNDALLGVAQTAFGSRSTVSLGDINNGDTELEAIFFPGQRVDFFVGGILKGSIASDIPQTASASIFFTLLVQTNQASANSVLFFGLDFRQKRL